MASDPPEAPSKSVGRRIGIAALIVGAGVFLSRILGFVRQIVFAAILGAENSADEYIAAFLLPDYINYLLAGGYLSITFMPIFLERQSKDGDESAYAAFVAVVRPVAVAIVAVVLLAFIFCEPIVSLASPGFDPEQVARTAYLTRIVLPAQIFFVIGSLLMAVQYAHEKFFIPTLAPLLYNTGIISGGIIGWFIGYDVEGFAWGVLAGAIIGNFGVQLWGARRIGLRWPREVRWNDPALFEYLKLALPLMLAQSVAALDELLARTFGSTTGTGSISWLNYARRVMMVPVGVLAQAAGVAAYPFLAKLAVENKIGEMADNIARTLRYLLYLSIGAAAALMVLSEPLVRVLFQRGKFGEADTEATAAALWIYALAIPIWGTQQIVARGFYARRQMWTPVLLGSIATIFALFTYHYLGLVLGYQGLAWASVASLGTYCLALLVVWSTRTGWAALSRIPASLFRAVICAGASYTTASLSLGLFTDADDWPFKTLVQLSAGSFAFGATWIIATKLLGGDELDAVLRRVTRRLRRGKSSS